MSQEVLFVATPILLLGVWFSISAIRWGRREKNPVSIILGTMILAFIAVSVVAAVVR